MMNCRWLIVVFAVSLVTGPAALGQLGGSVTESRDHSNAMPPAELPLLDRETAETYISVDGRAEIRVPPTAIRIVMAVTDIAATAGECRDRVHEKVKNLKAAWVELGVADEDIVTDFISVIPRYNWEIEERNGRDVGVENKVGYRMQVNLHVRVPDEAAAMEVLDAAFDQNVTDVLAFDYWNEALEQIKLDARRRAAESARSKAETLLSAVFDQPPPPINVQEATEVIYPESLYRSFQAAEEESVTMRWHNRITLIHAVRPNNTYYRGAYTNFDDGPEELPMNAKISVVSTVRIYFQSPAVDQQAAVPE